EQMKRAGFDFIQITGNMMRSEYEDLVSAARKSGLPLTGGVPLEAGLSRVIRARQSSIENLEGYLEALERDDSPIRLADPVTRARQLQNYYDESTLPGVSEHADQGTERRRSVAARGQRHAQRLPGPRLRDHIRNPQPDRRGTHALPGAPGRYAECSGVRPRREGIRRRGRRPAS